MTSNEGKKNIERRDKDLGMDNFNLKQPQPSPIITGTTTNSTPHPHHGGGCPLALLTLRMPKRFVEAGPKTINTELFCVPCHLAF